MTARQIPQRDIDVLKAAAHAAMLKAGGCKAVAEALDVAPSRVSEAASEWHHERHFNLLHVAEIEALAASPIITEALARISGFCLVPLAALTAKSDAQHLSDLITFTGAVQGRMAEAMVDGRVDVREAAALLGPVRAAIAQLQQLDAQLSHHLKGPQS